MFIPANKLFPVLLSSLGFFSIFAFSAFAFNGSPTVSPEGIITPNCSDSSHTVYFWNNASPDDIVSGFSCSTTDAVLESSGDFTAIEYSSEPIHEGSFSTSLTEGMTLWPELFFASSTFSYSPSGSGNDVLVAGAVYQGLSEFRDSSYEIVKTILPLGLGVLISIALIMFAIRHFKRIAFEDGFISNLKDEPYIPETGSDYRRGWDEANKYSEKTGDYMGNIKQSTEYLRNFRKIGFSYKNPTPFTPGAESGSLPTFKTKFNDNSSHGFL